MSDYSGSSLRDRAPLRRAVVCLAVLLGLALVVGGGTVLDARSAPPTAALTAVAGRTSSVCTVGSADALPGLREAPRLDHGEEAAQQREIEVRDHGASHDRGVGDRAPPQREAHS